MSYAGEFLVSAPMKRKADYGVFAKERAPICGEFGASQLSKCRGDDIRRDDIPVAGKQIVFGGIRPLVVTE